MYYTYVARQPIFNVNRVMIGYELLFRDGEFNALPPNLSLERSTYRLMVEHFVTIGRNSSLDDSRCFINFTHSSLINRLPLTLPKTSFIIQMLKTCEPDDDLYEAVRELYRSGYCLALDDLVYSPKWERFLPYIHIIKIDISVTGVDYACQFVTNKIQQGYKVQFLAKCVETENDFSRICDAGFELIQGSFFCKPLLNLQHADPEHDVAIQIVNQACQDKADVYLIESLISNNEEWLSRFMNFVNAESNKSNTEMCSFDAALTNLGEDKIKACALLTIVSSLTTNKTIALCSLSLQRARFFQLMSDKAPFDADQDQLFALGLLSFIDLLMDIPLTEIMKKMPLSPTVKGALTSREGTLGDLLNLHHCFEDADWNGLQRYCDKYSLTMKEVTKLLHIAQRWSQQMERYI